MLIKKNGQFLEKISFLQNSKLKEKKLFKNI